MEAIIIHGPQGCGKTTAAQHLKAKYGAQRVVDEWRPGVTLLPGDLALTNLKPPFALRARAIAFSEAQRG